MPSALHSNFRFRRLLAGLVVLLAVAAARPAFALDVEEVTWGFDGQVMVQRFNVLSVLVRNNTPEPYNGQLRLTKSVGAGAVDAPVVEEVFVSPFSSRWVQFYPYIQQEYESWHLSWGKSSRDRIDLPTLRPGPKARVLLTAPDNLAERGIGLKRLPDSLFPPYSTATDGLASVALDHVPRWEPVRRQAFLEWLQRGGILHLLLDSENKRLDFPTDLAELNAPLDEFRVGSGRVFRYSAGRDKVTAADIDLRESRLVKKPEDEESGKKDEVDEQSYFSNMFLNDFVSTVFESLRKMTRPDHNWGVIYLMAMVYVGLIFPGFFILGKQKLDYRIIYAAFLGVVALFSLGFAWVGRRGYGESTTVNNVAIARALPGGAWDVSLWSNAFVRDGDDYRIAHRASGALYSTAQTSEGVNGVIQNGPNAGILVDIPPYSSRTFAARMKVDGQPWNLKLTSPDVSAKNDGSLWIAGTFPPIADVIEVRALANGSMRTGRMVRDGVIHIDAGGDALDKWMKGLLSTNTYQMGYRWDTNENDTPDSRYNEMTQGLIARSLDLQKKEEAKKFSIPAGCVRLFVYAKMPPEFFIDNDLLGGQSGRVMYSVDFYPGEAAAGSSAK